VQTVVPVVQMELAAVHLLLLALTTVAAQAAVAQITLVQLLLQQLLLQEQAANYCYLISFLKALNNIEGFFLLDEYRPLNSTPAQDAQLITVHFVNLGIH
jgi:hypothetical protein